MAAEHQGARLGTAGSLAAVGQRPVAAELRWAAAELPRVPLATATALERPVTPRPAQARLTSAREIPICGARARLWRWAQLSRW